MWITIHQEEFFSVYQPPFRDWKIKKDYGANGRRQLATVWTRFCIKTMSCRRKWGLKVSSRSGQNNQRSLESYDRGRFTKANFSNSGEIKQSKKAVSTASKAKKHMEKNEEEQVECERNEGEKERAARTK